MRSLATSSLQDGAAPQTIAGRQENVRGPEELLRSAISSNCRSIVGRDALPASAIEGLIGVIAHAIGPITVETPVDMELPAPSATVSASFFGACPFVGDNGSAYDRSRNSSTYRAVSAADSPTSAASAKAAALKSAVAAQASSALHFDDMRCTLLRGPALGFVGQHRL
mgnify:CR=1 FL=1